MEKMATGHSLICFRPDFPAPMPGPTYSFFLSFLFAVLGLELRTYTLSYFTSPVL
jgi:hypothetical protein